VHRYQDRVVAAFATTVEGGVCFAAFRVFEGRFRCAQLKIDEFPYAVSVASVRDEPSAEHVLSTPPVPGLAPVC